MRHLSLFALVLLLGSCVGAKFTADTKTGQPIPIDTLNLVSVMIGPVYQPTFPLIDAAAFNGKTNKIADDILEEEEKRIADFKKKLVAALREKIPAEIRTTDEIRGDGIEEYQITRATPAENKNFPLVYFAEGDLSFQEYGNMNNLRNEFESNQALRQNIVAFAEKFNLSNVAICYNRLAVINVGPFGASGNLRLESYIYVFDSRGGVSIKATGILEPTNISGKVLDEYAAELDKHSMMYNLLAVPLSQQFMSQ